MYVRSHFVIHTSLGGWTVKSPRVVDILLKRWKFIWVVLQAGKRKRILIFWLETRAGTKGRYCLLFFSPQPPFPPKKPDQFPVIENNSFNNDRVSNKFLHHNSPHTTVRHCVLITIICHRNYLCSLMQLVAIWGRMCEHCYSVRNQQSGKFECEWAMKG